MTTPPNPRPDALKIALAANLMIQKVRRQGFPGPGQRQLMQNQRDGRFYWCVYAGMGDSISIPVNNTDETAAIVKLLEQGTLARTYDFRDDEARYTAIELYTDITWIAVGGTATSPQATSAPEIVILVARGQDPARDFVVTPAKDDPAALYVSRGIPGGNLTIFPFGDYCRLPDGRIGRHVLVDEAQRNLHARRVDAPDAQHAQQASAPKPPRTAFAARPDLL